MMGGREFKSYSNFFAARKKTWWTKETTDFLDTEVSRAKDKFQPHSLLRQEEPTGWRSNQWLQSFERAPERLPWTHNWTRPGYHQLLPDIPKDYQLLFIVPSPLYCKFYKTGTVWSSSPCITGTQHVIMSSKVDATGMSLVGLWLRFCTSSARGVGLMPGWGTKVPLAMLCSQNFFFN